MLTRAFGESSTTRPAAVSHGASLTFENLSQAAGPLRRRLEEDTLLRVIAGTVRVATDARIHVLGPGEEAIVPAGAGHRLSSASGPARVLMGFRPRSS